MEPETNKKKSIFKKWWFWVIIFFLIISSQNNSTTNNNTIHTSSNKILNTTNNITETNNTLLTPEITAKEEEKEQQKQEKEKQENIENTKWSLYATTEQVIKNRLKSPSTAKFSDPKAVYDEDNKIYKIQGTVDAQNSFGATIRSVFYAEYNNQLEIIYLVFDNEVLVDVR